MQSTASRLEADDCDWPNGIFRWVVVRGFCKVTRGRFRFRMHAALGSLPRWPANSHSFAQAVKGSSKCRGGSDAREMQQDASEPAPIRSISHDHGPKAVARMRAESPTEPVHLKQRPGMIPNLAARDAHSSTDGCRRSVHSMKHGTTAAILRGCKRCTTETPPGHARENFPLLSG